MEIEVLTIFPELFANFLDSSLIGKARERGVIKIRTLDIRNFAPLPHRRVDDSPYGGGAGMVMKPEPLAAAIHDAKSRLPSARVVLLTPSGEIFQQRLAVALGKLPALILVCGRYEGIDQRFIDRYVDQEISIGDYVLMGGELPAMVVIEAAVRHVASVIGNESSLDQESFNTDENGLLLEAPHYTRPPEFEGLSIPAVLTSGNHKEIARWRYEQALARTQARRPELLRQRKTDDHN